MIENLKDFGVKNVLIQDDKTYTYEQLYKQIKYLKTNLLTNIKSGEVVCIASDYSFYSIALLLALYENKNIIVPITTTLKSEIDERVAESYSTKIVTIKDGIYDVVSVDNQKTHEMLSSLRLKNHSGLVLFSSGSTGKPKAMIHDFDNLVEHYKGKKPKSMNMILFLMFDHIGGLNTLLNILSMGATAVVPKSRNADDVCKLVQDYKIMVLPSSPTFLNLILISEAHKKYDLSSLRMITYGTETMQESLLKRLKESFSKVKFLQTFGTSETGIANTASQSSNSTFMKIVDDEQEYKIVDGELWLRSKTQVMGYLNASMESFSEDGWFKTGDLVEQSEDGYIKIIGRGKEVINVGGEKVLPAEVESVLLSMDEIDDALVYASANAITGQSVVCDVVSSVSVSESEMKKLIRKYCKEKLDRYKIPTKVNLVERTNFSDRFKKMRIKF
ncbi:MAG: long-chain fatty acid--CoA ligase [Campylobacterales bacterium]|nr:long-chain fatty acid--CoA ligase [Campylobacterales bacterium]